MLTREPYEAGPSQDRYRVPDPVLRDLKKWFSWYVQSFYSSDPVIQKTMVLKERHSLRVCQEILKIGKKLGLSANSLRLAEAMALFHDIGRFEQFARYNTFVDKKSENHGELSVKVLEREKTLMALDEATREVIGKAIAYHNRLTLPDNEPPVCLYFSKLLRDADKLDIFHLVCGYYRKNHRERSAAIELNLPDVPEMSEEILARLAEGKRIGMGQLQSLNDFKLLQMGWIYDINFPPTFQLIYKRGYLRKIRDVLPASERVDRIYDSLVSYLKEKMRA